MKNNTTSLGDVHNGDYTRLIEENGKEYIYKPRNALTEKVWASFLCKLEELGAEYLPKAVKIISENENSHTEEVVKQLPTDKDGVKRYYHRMGSLLFLSYLLSTTDLHFENIIANGEYPVVVDLEALLSSNITNSNNKKGIFTTSYASSLLPRYLKNVDTSGIASFIKGAKNMPMINNAPVYVIANIDDILKGFSDTYDLVLAKKDEVVPCIEAFSHCTFREIIRNTRVYDYIMQQIKTSEDKRKTAYDLLSIAYRKDPDKERLNKAKLMLEAEIESVLKYDFPLFYVMGDSKDLYSNGKVVMKDFYTCSPVDFAKQKLNSLSQKDKEKEMKLISLSFESKKPLPKEKAPETDAVSQMISEFDRCFVPNFDSSFIVLTCENGTHSTFKSVGFGLYGGLCGILCAYCAAYAKTKREELLTKIELFLDQIEKGSDKENCRTFYDKREYELNDNSCSLSKGLAGTILGLLHCYELTENKRAYEIAVKIAKSIDIEKVDIKTFDVLSGVGGMCLVLPKLPKDIAYPIAKALSPYLVCDDCTLTGVAHGAAGRALALSAVQKVLGENIFDDEILRLLEFENSNFDKDENNWLDLRVTEKRAFMRGWCSGAPGIGMARKKMLEYTVNEKIIDICKKDIDRVKEFLFQEQKEYARATLCCGEASFVMACANLGVKCKNSLSIELRADSPKLLHSVDTADLNPTLMQGLAGVLYAYFMQDDTRCGGMLI